MLYGSRLNKLASGVKQFLSEAAVGSSEPGLSLDFTGESYRASGSSQPFNQAVTHSRSGNATMTDSDGLLKWAPHNLLTYSEDFSAAGWVHAAAGLTISSNAIEAPDGSLTADKLEETATTDHHRRGQLFSTAGSSRFSFFAKAAERQYARCWSWSGGNTNATIFDLSDGTIAADTLNATIEDAGNGWYKCEVDVHALHSNVVVGPSDTGARGTNTYAGVAGSGIYIWGAHLYRSDLGGMVDNPETGDSYVPTTSAAAYLPRVGHHEFNGYEWVNKGLLAESEARTNLVTYSEDFTDASWTKAAASVALDALGPDGVATSAATVTADGTAAQHYVAQVGVVANSTKTTFSTFAKAGSSGFIHLLVTGQNIYAQFDLSDGSLVNSSAGTGTLHSTTAEDVGNGWWRFSMTATQTAGGAADIRIYGLDAAQAAAGPSETSSGTILLYGAQVETGSVPSSYIPTSGATATRAAETFTVPAANLPWPQPEVISDELVVNGGFDSDSDWTKTGTAAIASGVGTLDGNSGTSLLYQDILTQNELYQASFDVSNLTGTLEIIKNDGTVIGSYTTEGTKTLVWLHDIANGNFIFRTNNGANDATVDNVSVREINPLSVSIAMKGEMDYADTGVSSEITFNRWFADINNYILTSYATDGAHDRMKFEQKASGTIDNAQNTSAPFSPGLNVPFDIASRHGSTFINGAVDGVALTEDTTPTELPDLSATDLELAYDFMGTIESFRVWDQDLGDSGIEEATAPSLEPSLNLTFDGSGLSFTDTGWTP